MKLIKEYMGEPVQLELAGKKEIAGVLIDFGSDVLVLFKQNDFYYVSTFHIREIRPLSKEEAGFIPSSDVTLTRPFDEKLSLKEVLHAAAKGHFVEVSMTGTQSVCGHVTNVLEDYVVMFSPLHETIFIPIRHIKWLVPYSADARPYGFKPASVPASASKMTASLFKDQLGTLKGSFITCNIYGNENISGQLVQEEKGFLQLLTVREKLIHLNIQHLKTVVPISFKEKQ